MGEEGEWGARQVVFLPSPCWWSLPLHACALSPQEAGLLRMALCPRLKYITYDTSLSSTASCDPGRETGLGRSPNSCRSPRRSCL